MMASLPHKQAELQGKQNSARACDSQKAPDSEGSKPGVLNPPLSHTRYPNHPIYAAKSKGGSLNQSVLHIVQASYAYLNEQIDETDLTALVAERLSDDEILDLAAAAFVLSEVCQVLSGCRLSREAPV